MTGIPPSRQSRLSPITVATNSLDIMTTRRQFTGLLCGSGLLSLAGCVNGGSSANETPSGAPQITSAPQSTSVTPGQSITLRVEASGSNLAYQWRRNGVALDGATGSSLQVVATGADSGAQYTVVVSNSAGQMESAAAILTVNLVAGISLLAGGLGGTSLLEGNGVQARILQPENVAVSKDGVVYFTCGILCGKVSAVGDVSFLGNLPDITINGMACDSKGDLYLCGTGVGVIYKLANGAFLPFAGRFAPYPGGGFLDGAGQAALLKLPRSPAFDAQDNLYFIDGGNNAIRKVSSAGDVATLAGAPANLTLFDGKGSTAGFAAPTKLLVLNDGSLLVLDGTSWRKIMPDGTVSTLAGTAPAFSVLAGVEANALYTLYGNSVVKLALDGGTVSVAGSQAEAGYADGFKGSARFNGPGSLAMAPDGKLFVADKNNAMIRRVDPASGQVSSWAGAAPQPGHVDGEGAQARFADMGPSCVGGDGNVYVIDTVAKTLRKVTSTGTASTLFTDFPSDGGVAVDASGSFYGVRNRTIVKVAPSGEQQVLAGQPGVLGYADGAGAVASFAQPMGLVIDAQGNLLVGDSPDIAIRSVNINSNDVTYSYGTTIRKITPTGVVSTIAGIPGQVITRFGVFGTSIDLPNPDTAFELPRSLACSSDGRIWVLDKSGVRRIDTPGATPVWLLRSVLLTSMAYAVGSPGDVYVSRESTISKLSADGTLKVVVGVDESNRSGVQLGALPGRLGLVASIASGATDLLYACSENSVLRIQMS